MKIKWMVMNLIGSIKRMFCDHEYETEKIAGFMVVNGWLVRPRAIKKCKKCGKILKEGMV